MCPGRPRAHCHCSLAPHSLSGSAQISPASGKHNRVPCHTTVSSESGNAVLSASRALIQRAPAGCAPCLTLDYKISSFIFSAGSRHGAGTGSQEGQEGHRGLFCENTHSLSLSSHRGCQGRPGGPRSRPSVPARPVPALPVTTFTLWLASSPNWFWLWSRAEKLCMGPRSDPASHLALSWTSRLTRSHLCIIYSLYLFHSNTQQTAQNCETIPSLKEHVVINHKINIRPMMSTMEKALQEIFEKTISQIMKRVTQLHVWVPRSSCSLFEKYEKGGPVLHLNLLAFEDADDYEPRTLKCYPSLINIH